MEELNAELPSRPKPDDGVNIHGSEILGRWTRLMQTGRGGCFSKECRDTVTHYNIANPGGEPACQGRRLGVQIVAWKDIVVAGRQEKFDLGKWNPHPS